MRLSELIAELETIQDAYPNEDPEVRLAMQPQWPFEYSIHSAVCFEGAKDEAPIVYLSEGSQLGYLPGEARDVAW